MRVTIENAAQKILDLRIEHSRIDPDFFDVVILFGGHACDQIALESLSRSDLMNIIAKLQGSYNAI